MTWESVITSTEMTQTSHLLISMDFCHLGDRIMKSSANHELLHIHCTLLHLLLSSPYL